MISGERVLKMFLPPSLPLSIGSSVHSSIYLITSFCGMAFFPLKSLCYMGKTGLLYKPCHRANVFLFSAREIFFIVKYLKYLFSQCLIIIRLGCSLLYNYDVTCAVSFDLQIIYSPGLALNKIATNAIA